MHTRQVTVESPVGSLVVSERGGKIVALDWGTAVVESDTPVLAAAARQLNAYFYCELQRFDLPLAPAGTTFQQAVWKAMQAIPYGKTRSYADLARQLDSGPRAIGGACGRNPMPILIPCHRVLASGDRIGGYTSPGGLETKRFLLQLE
ncbi:MAG TPA: methylated-DNA--[protein]-cysteine S-methyltransferase, partial [Methylomirabilota bacterium]|nr:methylated-DNA--[protein]-cysteine S-methyltransferase [Methylomirabilota bacterium]